MVYIILIKIFVTKPKEELNIHVILSIAKNLNSSKYTILRFEKDDM